MKIRSFYICFVFTTYETLLSQLKIFLGQTYKYVYTANISKAFLHGFYLASIPIRALGLRTTFFSSKNFNQKIFKNIR